MSEFNARRCPSNENKKNRSNSTVNLRTKLHKKSELKSSIPKPSPCLRSSESFRARSSSSCQSQPIHPSKIPVPLWSADRGKTSTSLQYKVPSSSPVPGSREHPEHRSYTKSQSPPPRPKLPPSRPKSANVFRNPYPNVKAKVNSKPLHTPQPKSHFNPLSLRLVATPDSTTTDVSKVCSTDNGHSTIEEESISGDKFFEDQKEILKQINELKAHYPKELLQPLENEISKLMHAKSKKYSKEPTIDSTLLSNDGSPEFLTKFDSQVEDVSKLWLRLICDVIATKSTIPMSRLSLPDPTLDAREEVYKFLSLLPEEGNSLHNKLLRIEDEQRRVKTVVMHNAMALFKQYEDLKDSHFRLEKTQDQIHFELKEQLAILGEENQQLDEKYEKAVEKYNVERIKTEQQEKLKMTINKEILEAKKIMKIMEGKCHEWEIKTKKSEAACRNLEVAIRNKDLSIEKESKNHREVLSKYKESKDNIEKLKSKLMESNQSALTLELANKELQDELVSKKAELEELEQKRNELLEELTHKSKKLKDSEERLNSIQAYISNSTPGIMDMYDIPAKSPLENLLKDTHQKDVHIQELKKDVNRLEHMLKEKTTREEILMIQVAELQKQPHENEVALRTQIRELQYELKDMGDEKAELERMIAQKTLELDQRDLLMREHSQILRARDELIPMVQSKQRREKEYVEKLSAIIIDQQKTYFNQGNDDFTNNGEPNLHEMMQALEKRYSLDPKMVDKELTFRQEKMTELFNLLEHKQMEMMRLERRIRELQGVREEKEIMEKEKEARISSLQKALEDRKSGKSRGKKFFILFLRKNKNHAKQKS